MKSLTVLMALAAFGGQTGAQAAELTPQNTHFKAKGRVALVGGDPKRSCTLTMKGGVNEHGRGVIRSFTLSGKAQECSAVPTGLPWTVKAQGKLAVDIYGIGYQDPVAPCRTRDIAVGVSGTGEWTFTQCIQGTLATTPPITTVRRNPR